MELSARNQYACKVKSIRKGPIHSEVTLVIEGTKLEMTAVITSGSVKRLALKKGSPAVALVKSSAVILGVE